MKIKNNLQIKEQLLDAENTINNLNYYEKNQL